MGNAAREAKVAIHAYGLATGEVRMLASPENSSGLADLMQGIGRRYVPWFNSKYGCIGSPWDGRFRSAAIEADSCFLSCLRYVESYGANNLSSEVGNEPPWSLPSSAAHHQGSGSDELVIDHPAFWALGNTPFERQAAYGRLLDRPVSKDETAAISCAALNGWALGSETFMTLVGTRCGRRAERATPGRRPKRVELAPTIVMSPFKA